MRDANRTLPAEKLAQLEEGDIVEAQYARGEKITGGGTFEVEEVPFNDEEVWLTTGEIWRATNDGGVREYTEEGHAGPPSVVNIEVL